MNGLIIQNKVLPGVPSWVLNGRNSSEKKTIIEIAKWYSRRPAKRYVI